MLTCIGCPDRVRAVLPPLAARERFDRRFAVGTTQDWDGEGRKVTVLDRNRNSFTLV